MSSKPFYRTPPSYPYTFDGSLILITSEMVDLKVSTAAIITRPPEILACLKMAVSPTLNIFIIFDSHPRPQYADGAGLLVFGKLEGAARALTELFPVVDLSKSGLQWQAQLLSNYSAHILVPRPVHDRQAHFRHVAMDSSLEVLALRERARQTDATMQENQRLERRVEELEQQLRRERAKGKRAELTARSSHNAAIMRPKELSRDNIGSTSTFSVGRATPTARLAASQPSGSRATGRRSQDTGQPSSMDIQSSHSDDALHIALELQRAFDEENQNLMQQMSELSREVQRTFKCEVCFDELPEDVVMRVNGCGHGFCRDCIRGHVQSKLQEHRYPILCPVCAASRDDDRKPCGIVGVLYGLRPQLTMPFSHRR